MEEIEKLMELPELMPTVKSMADYYERSGNTKYLRSSVALIKGMKQDFEAARETLSSQYCFNIDGCSAESLSIDYSIDLGEIDSSSDPASQIMAVTELYSEFRETEKYVASIMDRTDMSEYPDVFPEDR